MCLRLHLPLLRLLTLALRIRITRAGATLHTAFSTDRGHMGAISAYNLPALTAGFAGFVAGKLVRGALAVRGSAALAGDLTLLFPTH
jgi:hypothetical protein